MASANSPKSARIETRVSVEQKELIERAAAYSGKTVSDFMVTHVESAAIKVVGEYERLILDQRQSKILVDALISEQEPNDKLKSVMKKYRAQVEGR